MTFRPMLASECKDVSKLRYPILASAKLDGIRATVQGGRLVSRTLKPIPNVNVQAMFKGLPEGIDGELIQGSPSDDPYRRTVSVVMSEDKPADGIGYYVFDSFGCEGFDVRIRITAATTEPFDDVHVVQHVTINNAEELAELEATKLAEGFEGLMLRSINGPYKQGRSTEKEGYLLKLKQFKDAEARIIGFGEQLHNGNEATTNALGRTERSSHKANMTGTGVLGQLEVIGVGGDYDGVAFSIGGGFTAAMRETLWINRDGLRGQLLKFKYFPTGSKDKPRFPVYLGPRHKEDL